MGRLEVDDQVAPYPAPPAHASARARHPEARRRRRRARARLQACAQREMEGSKGGGVRQLRDQAGILSPRQRGAQREMRKATSLESFHARMASKVRTARIEESARVTSTPIHLLRAPRRIRQASPATMIKSNPPEVTHRTASGKRSEIHRKSTMLGNRLGARGKISQTAFLQCGQGTASSV